MKKNIKFAIKLNKNRETFTTPPVKLDESDKVEAVVMYEGEDGYETFRIEIPVRKQSDEE